MSHGTSIDPCPPDCPACEKERLFIQSRLEGINLGKKVTEMTAKKIRTISKARGKHEDIATRFGVAASTVSLIKRGAYDDAILRTGFDD